MSAAVRESEVPDVQLVCLNFHVFNAGLLSGSAKSSMGGTGNSQAIDCLVRRVDGSFVPCAWDYST